MSRYIDLTHAIIRNWHTPAVVKGIRAAMQWLDEHPDQVPGRTITESQIAEAFGDEYHYWAKRRLSRIGITVVPDPEPTNAEKLANHVLRITDDLYIGLPKDDIDKVANWLDEAGVKAPGGDDDH